MPIDLNKFIEYIEKKGQDAGISKNLIDRAINATKEFSRYEPDIHEPDPDIIQLPHIPTIANVKCSLCGKEALMNIKEKRKPCLVCGFVNVL